jgi:hypothetical protein
MEHIQQQDMPGMPWVQGILQQGNVVVGKVGIHQSYKASSKC